MAARARLAAMLPNDVVVLTLEAFVKQEMDYWADRVAIGFIFNLGSLMGLPVGVVIVYSILYTDVTDHLNEYATLKAIGYLDRQLFSVVIQESLILSKPLALILETCKGFTKRDPNAQTATEGHAESN